MTATLDTSALPLAEFVDLFGEGLLESVARRHPPVFDGTPNPRRDAVMDALARRPFTAQRAAVQALGALLLDAGEKAAILNGEMGVGKTLQAIAASAILHDEGFRRTLVVAPPHLTFKWRREILETIPEATVVVCNGPDALAKLMALRALIGTGAPKRPFFVVLGRVRMRMDFHWRPVIARRVDAALGQVVAACPGCGAPLLDEANEPLPPDTDRFAKERAACPECGEALWTLVHPRKPPRDYRAVVRDGLLQLPTVGPKTAERILDAFGEEVVGGLLADNLYDVVNLMDEAGELIFSDRQAARMERALGRLEFSFAKGGYQVTEAIKRYLPQGFFGLLVADEAHEYKNAGSSQGQAFGVLAAKARKVLLLTGTLMGGYGDDLFHLLWRAMPQRMIEDGYRYNGRGSLGTAAMAFMRHHGVFKEIQKHREVKEGDHATAKGKRITIHTAKGPGFGPLGIMRYVVPYTVFLKLADLGAGVLPDYREELVEVAMGELQAKAYGKLNEALTTALRAALRVGDHSLLGVVLNSLLAWPDTCFRPETVTHPRTRRLITFLPRIAQEGVPTPKERALIERCKEERAAGRRVLAYTTYTGTRDTTARLKGL
ncbi:SNF2-related protein, partial [Endothiovibrio diazotrophicus]